MLFTAVKCISTQVIIDIGEKEEVDKDFDFEAILSTEDQGSAFDGSSGPSDTTRRPSRRPPRPMSNVAPFASRFLC